MKLQLVLRTAAVAALLSPILAAGEGWTSDFAAAKAQADEEKKSLLVDFTGSDWCGWCIKLNDEVFKHDAFKDGVKDKFVLVELDYPRDKTKLSEETQKQNEELREQYSIQGYPTILLMDEKGRPFARTGYQAGGPENYVKHLDELLQARAKRDEAMASATNAEGADKAKALVAALDAMGLDDAVVSTHYADVVEQIKASDPEDESGFVKKLETNKKFADFESSLNGLAREGKHDEALELTNGVIDSGDFEGEKLQQAKMIKGMICAQMQDFDAALAALDEAKAVDPDSELGGRVDTFKERINQMKAAQESKEGEEDAPEKE